MKELYRLVKFVLNKIAGIDIGIREFDDLLAEYKLKGGTLKQDKEKEHSNLEGNSYRVGDTIIHNKFDRKPLPASAIHYAANESETILKGRISDIESYLCRRKFKILIVDDEEDVVLTLKTYSEDIGFKNTDGAYSAEDAIEKLNKNRYDLVLCDYKLGEMTGYAVFKHIKSKIKPTERPSFVLISGYSDDEIEMLKRAGVVFLPKPLNMGKLETVIKGFYIKKLRENIKTLLLS
jgi:CheY-like chemotaxis protein